MNKMLIMMMALIFVSASPQAWAQDTPSNEEEEFFDDEVEAGEEIDEEVDGDAVPTPEERPPRRRGRFGRNSGDEDNSDSNPQPVNSSANSRFSRPPVNNRPTTPVKEIKVSKKVSKGKKLKFADAHPEDITNANFPEMVETFDYPNADITDIAKAISKLTGKNFIFEPGVRGKITIVAPSKITVAEAWEAFLSALAMNGFSVVPAGKFLKIRKLSNAKDDSIETFAEGYYPTSDQLITRIIKLKYINAEDVKKSIGKLVSKKAGDILAYDKTNSLIVSGYGSSIERISRIIEELDRPGFEERLEVIPIKNAKAKDISELIDKIINKGEKDKKSRFRSSRFNKAQDGKNEALSLVAPDERTNSIIVVGNEKGVQRIKTLVKRLDYPLDPADAGGVYVYYVKHGEAVKIAETLSGIAEETDKKAKSASKSTGKSADNDFEPPKKQKPLFGGNVVMKADENTNSLIITANKQDYKTVKNLLSKIDIPKDQVFVEAIIMEMEASNQDLWNLNYMKFFSTEGAAAGQDGIARAGFQGGSIGDLLNPIGGKGAVINLGDPSETVSIRSPTGTIQIPSLLALVNFLKEKTNANILSTPHIIAMDNEESEIEVGDEVPVGGTQNFSGTTNLASITPTFKDATIHLKIKPFISPDSDVVRLNVEQKIQKVSTKPIQAQALAQTTQALTKKLVKTNIVLKSGQTAVLGGLMEDQDTVSTTKIPLLGDIPVLGWLFKSRTVSKEKKNLVVFLTPRIIRNTYDHDVILKEKLNQRVDWIKKNARGRDPYGERFNSLINSKSTASSGGDNTYDAQGEMELDLEEAVPIDDSPEVNSGGGAEDTAESQSFIE